MSKIIIALCLLAIVLFVAAQEAAPAKKGNDLKTKLVQRIKDKVREKLDQRNPKAPAVKLPLKERIANLKEKIAKLETKRDQRRAARKAEKKDEKPKSRKPRSDKPKSRKPKSDKPRSRKPKSDKPAKKEKKDQKPKSRKPKSDKPKSRKPRSRKPKSDKPAKEAETESDSEAGAFTLATLQKLFPHLPAAKASAYFPHLEAAMNGAGINTCLRRSAFLAQVGHESGELKWFEEFASGAAYEGRRDLGNTQPGDGKRYKGRGPIQVTGRANYRAAGQALGVDLENNPTWAALPQYGFKVAAWFWNSRSLNGHADKGTQAEFDVITKRINGGYNGKADRDRLWKIARAQLGC